MLSFDRFDTGEGSRDGRCYGDQSEEQKCRGLPTCHLCQGCAGERSDCCRHHHRSGQEAVQSAESVHAPTVTDGGRLKQSVDPPCHTDQDCDGRQKPRRSRQKGQQCRGRATAASTMTVRGTTAVCAVNLA